MGKEDVKMKNGLDSVELDNAFFLIGKATLNQKWAIIRKCLDDLDEHIIPMLDSYQNEQIQE